MRSIVNRILNILMRSTFQKPHQHKVTAAMKLLLRSWEKNVLSLRKHYWTSSNSICNLASQYPLPYSLLSVIEVFFTLSRFKIVDWYKKITPFISPNTFSRMTVSRIIFSPNHVFPKIMFPNDQNPNSILPTGRVK